MDAPSQRQLASVRLDRRLATPLFRQVCQRIREAILDGSLPPGTSLPSTRSRAGDRLQTTRGNSAMRETSERMHERLLEVIAKSRFEPLSQPYAWQAIPDARQIPDGALAAVRDGDAWYALAPSIQDAKGNYRVFSFHFAEGTNASGFVAWLAALMKEEAGTGAMVVCGFDARDTPALWQTSLGLFDFWGCPWSKGDAVLALVEHLRRIGSSRG